MKIEVKNLRKLFKSNVIIDDINYTFTPGKIYGLYGRNGSGKSVFLKLVCGFYKPTSGEVLINGKNYNLLNEFPTNVRSLIEEPHFLPNLTGYKNLKYLASIQNKISDKEILKSLEQVNLIDEKDKLFSKYSLGMKQKLGIAQALMENPDILILDEPFNGIEEETVKKIRKVLKELSDKGKIIIIASHIKEDIEELSDVKLKFDNGKIS